jgi:hypothetical protein
MRETLVDHLIRSRAVVEARAVSTDPDALFRQVLEDPFGLKTRDHIDQWHYLLMSEFPLWPFQAWAYDAILRPRIPSNYPHQRMIDSIVADDGMAARGLLPGKPKLLEPLELAVDNRRYALASQGRYGPGTGKLSSSARQLLPLQAAQSQFNRLYPLAEPADDDAIYNIGRKAIHQLEHWLANRGKEAIAQRDRFWKDLAQELGIVIKRGRPAALVGTLLQDLTNQGHQLMELCWTSRSLVTQKTVKVLKDQGVTTEEEIELWAARLALPVLSLPEIESLREQPTKASDGRRPTPRRFAIWLLEHRLGIDATTIARQVSGPSYEVYFKNKNRKNPIPPHS